MPLNLSDQDRTQIHEHGLSETSIATQLKRFADGVPFTILDRACTPGDGLRQLSTRERAAATGTHNAAAAAGKLMKFVPASGAASRMFKSLLALYDDDRLTRAVLEHESDYDDADIAFGRTFFNNLDKFAFFPQLQAEVSRQGHDIDVLLTRGDFTPILAAMFDADGLNMAALPKGLIAFHGNGDNPRTPVAEHLHEAVETVLASDKSARLHFTVSPEHQDLFEAETAACAERNPDTNFTFEFSQQSPSTDTIAVDVDNQPFRDEAGNLVFRPGGHGALIKNLAELDADVVFVKNIDNVLPHTAAETSNEEKRVLSGYAIQLLEERDLALHDLEMDNCDAKRLAEINTFATEELQLHLPGMLEKDAISRQFLLLHALNRPLRVCGMVKNEGDPGGGPFWVKQGGNRIDRQIVETVQVDPADAVQQAILASATHFNPVDLVCVLRDHHGRKYDLHAYVDHDTAFISHKSKDGKDLKALELPGLWNGSMADWLTVFVEVPAHTFNPVKTVNDLLEKEHQG
jgi:Domain of unknown function (DUF4301)